LTELESQPEDRGGILATCFQEVSVILSDYSLIFPTFPRRFSVLGLFVR